MRPLPPPFDAIAAGRTAAIGLSGPNLLADRLLTKDLAFPPHERDAFALHGLLRDATMTIEEQVELELERLHRPGRPTRAVHRSGGAPGPQRHAVLPGAGREPGGAVADRLDAAMWWPAYVPYRPAREEASRD